jgi:ABC-type branched-subunit amino acid transport system substrate-binding protein
VQHDVAAEGAQIFCAGCHGRSGMGVGEGQTVVPAVTGSLLFQPREIRRKQLYDARTLRPAYSDGSLARAIRAGTDAGGRTLDSLMPRYALGDADLQSLIRYLKTLSSQISPGVSATDIHFATVITDDVDPRRRRAMLDVLEAFFASKSAETRHEASRSGRSPFHMERHYQAYRKWNLHVWELRGPPAGWRAQLERFYEQQPVFAVIGGVGGATWHPIHEFCEQREVPCLLPNTDLPVVAESDYYSIYFSKGMELEAQVLAKHLGNRAASSVVQVYRSNARGETAAAGLRQALKAHGMTDVQDRVVADGTRLSPELWRSIDRHGAASVVLWLDDGDLADVEAAARTAPVRRVYVSSTLAGDSLRAIAARFHGEVYAIWLEDLPEDSVRRLRVLDVWLRSKAIVITDPPLQANTLFAATLAAQALKHIGSNFYRDYFIERIEHIFDSMVAPSAYPKLGLAPNQRYASKGGYVLRISKDSGGEPTQGREWIVP